MSIVGSVTVRVVPSFDGVHRQISRQMTGAASQAGSQAGTSMSKAMSASLNLQAVGGAIQDVGKQIGDIGSTLTKKITMPIAGATIAAGGLVATLGWGRLKSIDTAQAQLRGLGYETEDVERISAQLTDALEGGMLTMGEATAAAAAGMAAGVEEGEELTRYIQLLDAATAGSNGTFDEMNQIFARIQGSGKLMTNELQMIEQRMPGFSAAVAEHLGVPQEEMREMVSQGQVSADDFLDIMDDFGGDMATEYAKSWEGMVQNTLAYIGILGQNILEGVFQMSKEEIADFIDLLSSEEAQEWAREFGESITEVFARVVESVRNAWSWWQSLDDETKNLIGSVAGLAVAAGPVLIIVGRVLGVVGGLISGIGVLVGWVSSLVTGFVGAAAAVGQFLWAAIRILGPIGLIITVLVTMWRTSEDFRDAVMDLGSTLMDSFSRVWDALQPLVALLGDILITIFEKLAEVLPPVVEWLADKLAWGIENIVIPAIEWLTDVIVAVIDWLVGLGDESTTQGQVVREVWDQISTTMSWLWENVIKPVFNFMVEAWDVLSTAFMWAWENVIEPVLGWFAETGLWLWEEVLKPVFGFIGEAWNVLATAIKWAWDNIIAPVLGWFGDNADWLWNDVLKPTFNWIAEAWETMSDAIKWAWDNVIEPVFSWLSETAQTVEGKVTVAFGVIGDQWENLSGTFSRVWGWIKETLQEFQDWIGIDFVGAFKTAVDTIGDIWDGIKSFFANPLQWVARNVWNPFANTLNKIFEFLNMKFRLGTISVNDPTPARSGGSRTSGVGGGSSQVDAFAKGGVMGDGWKLVGEEGPELIRTGPGWVATADETKQLLARGESLNSGLGIGDGDERPSRLRMLSDMVLRGGRSVAEGEHIEHGVQLARGGIANFLEAAVSPLKAAMDSWADGSLIHDMVTGLPRKAMDGAIEWARGQDEKDTAGGTYGGEFVGNPGGFNRPAQGVISSMAGRRSYFGRFGNMHYGVDIANLIGTPIRAAWDGVVRRVYGGGMDKRMVINHGGWDTSYLHNASHRVGVGDSVTGGQVIGTMGTAGTGPHLHFELHPGGWYNPSVAGVNALFRDKGGLIYPGMNQVLNETGKAEYVFNQAQFENLNRLAENGGSGGAPLIGAHHSHNYGRSGYAEAQDLRFTMRREAKRMKAGV